MQGATRLLMTRVGVGNDAMVAAAVTEQPLFPVTVTVYTPDARFVAVAVVWVLLHL